MTRQDLQTKSTAELVDLFVRIALAQDEAMLMDENAEYARLYRKMEEVEIELKLRPGDQRRELNRLFDHSNAQVRLKAAISTLVLAPEEARRVLQIISDRHEYPQAADARGMMNALDDGSYVPS